MKKYKGEEIKKFFDTINSKTGIVFFRNYWGLNNQGDHIDLWNRSRLTDWRSWIYIHIYGETYTKSQEIWFWPIS